MKAYTLKIRGGVERDSMGKKAGKGALIQEEVSATLGVSQDQTLFQPVPIATIEGNGTRESHRGSGISEGVAYAIENHPNDSRVGIDESGKVQTLTSRCGTGGGAMCLSSCSARSGEQSQPMILKHGTIQE